MTIVIMLSYALKRILGQFRRNCVTSLTNVALLSYIGTREFFNRGDETQKLKQEDTLYIYFSSVPKKVLL